MNPEDIVRPCDYEFYQQVPKPPQGWPERDSPKALRKSVDRAHDNFLKQARVNDKLQKQLLEMEDVLKKERKWRKWLISALVLTWTSWAGVVWWASKVLAPIVVKGLGH